MERMAATGATEGMAERVSEMKRDALRTGWPTGKKQKELLSMITRIDPREVILHTQVTMWLKVWDYWESGAPVDWNEIAPIDIKETKAISERGKSRIELRDISQFFPQEEQRGILSRFRR